MNEENVQVQENNQVQEQPVQPAQEATVQISEQDMDNINKEIESVEESKINEAKNEAKQEVMSEVDKLAKELEEIKRQNELAKKQQEEKDKIAKLRAEIQKEQEWGNQIRQKHVVQESNNPTRVEQAQPQQEVQLSHEQSWAAFENALKSGMSATIDIKKQ